MGKKVEEATVAVVATGRKSNGVSNAVHAKGRETCLSFGMTHRVQVGITLGDTGREKKVYASIKADTGGRAIMDYLASDPRDKDGKALTFKLRYPPEEDGMFVIGEEQVFSAEGLIKFCEFVADYDFLSLLKMSI